MPQKETGPYEKTLFADFIRELLNRRNLSFRRVAKIGQDLGFEVSASAIYKATRLPSMFQTSMEWAKPDAGRA